MRRQTAHVDSHIHIYLPTYLHTYLPTYLPTCIYLITQTHTHTLFQTAINTLDKPFESLMVQVHKYRVFTLSNIAVPSVGSQNTTYMYMETLDPAGLLHAVHPQALLERPHVSAHLAVSRHGLGPNRAAQTTFM